MGITAPLVPQTAFAAQAAPGSDSTTTWYESHKPQWKQCGGTTPDLIGFDPGDLAAFPG